MNLFLCCLTSSAPTANYRGESVGSRAMLQKVAVGDHEHPVVSPEALRSALREMLRGYGLPCNRRREKNEPQLAVSYQDFPDADRFADDFFFGYMVTNREQIPEERRAGYRYKRDSIVRNNLAVGLTPYRQETLFTHSPHTVSRDGAGKPKWSNTTSSVLLHREIAHTRFQFPLALNLADCELSPSDPENFRNVWFSTLLLALSELSGVAGNQTRSLFSMAPASMIARVTSRLAPGFPLYPFTSATEAPELIDLVVAGDLPGKGIHLGGEIVRQIDPAIASRLSEKGALLHRTVDGLLDVLSRSLCGRPLPQDL